MSIDTRIYINLHKSGESKIAIAKWLKWTVERFKNSKINNKLTVLVTENVVAQNGICALLSS